MTSRIISLMKTVKHRLFSGKRVGHFLLESPDGLRLMVSGSPNLPMDLAYIWGLSSWKSTPVLQRNFAGESCDLMIEEKLGAQQDASTQRISTQLFVDMLTPLRSNFESFLVEVLSKKKRYHVKKALEWDHSLEQSRDESSLDMFLDSMLHPQTASTHKEQAHHLLRSDVLRQGAQWELLLIKEGADYQGGSLLLHSKRQGILRIWRQAVHPNIRDGQAINRIKIALDAAAIKAACQHGYTSLSFGLAPHVIEHGNFYSKRLWACEPVWNQAPQFIDIQPLSERGVAFFEQIPMLCLGTEQKPNAVLVPKSRFTEDHAGLKSWLDRFAFNGLSHLAVWDAGRLNLHPIQTANSSRPLPSQLTHS